MNNNNNNNTLSEVEDHSVVQRRKRARMGDEEAARVPSRKKEPLHHRNGVQSPHPQPQPSISNNDNVGSSIDPQGAGDTNDTVTPPVAAAAAAALCEFGLCVKHVGVTESSSNTNLCWKTTSLNVHDLKQEIAHRCGVPPDRQRLIYFGKMLHDATQPLKDVLKQDVVNYIHLAPLPVGQQKSTTPISSARDRSRRMGHGTSVRDIPTTPLNLSLPAQLARARRLGVQARERRRRRLMVEATNPYSSRLLLTTSGLFSRRFPHHATAATSRLDRSNHPADPHPDERETAILRPEPVISADARHARHRPNTETLESHNDNDEAEFGHEDSPPIRGGLASSAASRIPPLPPLWLAAATAGPPPVSRAAAAAAAAAAALWHYPPALLSPSSLLAPSSLYYRSEPAAAPLWMEDPLLSVGTTTMPGVSLSALMDSLVDHHQSYRERLDGVDGLIREGNHNRQGEDYRSSTSRNRDEASPRPATAAADPLQRRLVDQTRRAALRMLPDVAELQSHLERLSQMSTSFAEEEENDDEDGEMEQDEDEEEDMMLIQQSLGQMESTMRQMAQLRPLLQSLQATRRRRRRR